MATDSETPSPVGSNPLAPQDYTQQQATKLQLQANIDMQVAIDMLHNPEYDDFFEPYHPEFRLQFIKNYVHRRKLWTQEGDLAEWYLAGKLSQFEQEAYTRLWDIQQKKLFDLQCEWRAELVQVPGIRLSYDFVTVSEHIENCLLIPPITPDELELYMSWVASINYEEHLI